MDNRPVTVDNRAPNVEHLVDSSVARFALWHTLACLDTTPILTTVGRIGATAPSRRVAPKSSPPLSEETLIRAYGLDPTDLERELIERRGYEPGPG